MGEIIAVSVVGLFAFFGAAWGVVSQRSITRRQVTLHHITKQESDGDLLAAHRIFLKISKTPGLMASYADVEKQDTEEAQAVRVILNEYELVAIGIQAGILSFTMYRRWHRSGIIKCWDASAPYVHVLRDQLKNPRIYFEFEQMVSWMKGESMPKRSRYKGLFF